MNRTMKGGGQNLYLGLYRKIHIVNFRAVLLFLVILGLLQNVNGGYVLKRRCGMVLIIAVVMVTE